MTKALKKLRTYFLLLLSSLIFSCEQEIQHEKMIDQSYSFLLGGYTNDTNQGIGLLVFNPENQSLETKIIGPGIKNPSFVISNKAQTLVFAVEETGGENGGKIKSFKFDRENNRLILIDTQDTFGDHPCYLALDKKEEFIVVGNYSGGNFSAYKVKEGKLEHVQTIQHEGQSILRDRQGSAHVHSTVFHPNGKYLLVGDLGTDKIHIYHFNPGFAVPFNHAPVQYFEVDPGSGPRHLAIHPSGNTIYLVHELSAELGVYGFDNGRMFKKQVQTLTDDDYIGTVGAAEVRISPDAHHVYVSNRGDANEITVFEILKDETLKFVERIKTGGTMPRNFILTKDGEYLLVAHQGSNNITVFERDHKSGKLKKLEIEAEYNQPVYFFGLD
ncbi:lactonase family protein [Cecembia calidifontis]|jgi:6-phosphogluconolactonase|uniref:6-phosphogluconolactonase n=1 Tax=Cecembia calidifontis TaxID=1187080 RepID=A0A4Q7PAK4_9BACT|nr:lactonase family protein [Cecembia calidifontis]RZS97215.1 6-phosphogluconolactonase [Cecembia calidifontis]